jgi:ABC-type branched-subunit amino acid transport system ATPase component
VAPLLDVSHIDAGYGTVQILFDVSLHVDDGEVLALLGTNGAGKSTLLRVVSGLLKPTGGSVSFDGRDITRTPAHARVEAGIVQLVGGNAVFPTMTVRDNLRAAAFTILRDHRRVERRIISVLDLVPAVRARLDQTAGTLSGGEQQMVAVAMALLTEPRLLIIDELSLGLAPVVVGHLIDVISGLKERHVSMLIVEQSLNVAAAFADRAVFMERGEVRFTGDVGELIDNGDLARAVFLGATS